MNAFFRFFLGLMALVLWSLFWSWVLFGWLDGGELTPCCPSYDIGGVQ
jgi:hypothetical protein